MISQLDFYIEDVINPKVLIVKDASFYNPDITPTGAQLVIQYPGSNMYVSTPVGINFRYVINSNTLGITNVVKQSSLAVLPDGLYTIRYSICPNDELYVEYKFLRNVKQLIKYYNAYCGLELQKCSHKCYMAELDQLKEIKQYIDSAKYLADCDRYDNALEMYDYADELLSKFTSNCKCYG